MKRILINDERMNKKLRIDHTEEISSSRKIIKEYTTVNQGQNSKKVKIYEGEFLDSLRDGNGLLFDESENLIYKGKFRRGMKHGFGTLYNIRIKNRKDIYHLSTMEGFFHLDVLDYGKIYINGNKVYQGTFKNNIPHGLGSLYIKIRYMKKEISCYYYGFLDNFQPCGQGKLIDDSGNFLFDVICSNNNIKIIDKNNKDIGIAQILINFSKNNK